MKSKIVRGAALVAVALIGAHAAMAGGKRTAG
jgi:hypothetical protein